VGVHIRLTDKKLLNDYSDESLEQDIVSTFSKLQDTTIFICSDDLTVETEIVSRFPNCIHFQKSHLLSMENNKISRSKESCLEALIDFYIFCGCPKKYGINSNLHSSTFFQVSTLFQESFRRHYLTLPQNDS
jgi:hypothetical protein